jgi:hypothetical protein
VGAENVARRQVQQVRGPTGVRSGTRELVSADRASSVSAANQAMYDGRAVVGAGDQRRAALREPHLPLHAAPLFFRRDA